MSEEVAQPDVETSEVETSAGKTSTAEVPEVQANNDDENTETSEKDRTLAEQVRENEYQMYQRSCQQYQAIEDEVRQTQQLCSPKEDIEQMIAGYDPVSSPQYFQKAVELGEKYKNIRRIRGDGNCFYRAVLTALLERCFDDKPLLDRFAANAKGWRAKLIGFGFPELTTGDFCDAVDTLLESMKDGTKTMDFLYDDLNNDAMANYYVAFMRLIASGYLRENEDLYSGFIEGLRNLDQYCKDEVEPMWKDADHIAVIALVNAIDVPIRIEYMDQSLAPNGGWHHDLPEDSTPQLFFLYRPGHYDVLYPK